MSEWWNRYLLLVRGVSGHLDHQLHSAGQDDRLFAELNVFWGWADSTGKLIGTLHATGSDVLLDDPCRFSNLSVQWSDAAPWYLDKDYLERLIQMVDSNGLSIKYEGVPFDGQSDGILDISHVELSQGGEAFLLEERWGDRRFLVLQHTWYNLAVGSVLRLQSNTLATSVNEDSDDELFLRSVLDAIY